MLVVLVHMLFGDDPPGHRVAGAATGEAEVLRAARAVIATSGFTRDRILSRYALAPDRR